MASTPNRPTSSGGSRPGIVRRSTAIAACAAALLVIPASAVATPAGRSTALPPADLAHASATGQPIKAGCSTRGWGARPKSVPRQTTATIRNIRAGRHACFDRLVVDVGPTRPALGWAVHYVDRVVSTADRPVPLRGGADLQVVVHAPAYDGRARATYDPKDWAEAVNVRGYRTFRQVSLVESFEGDTVIGVGTRAKLPFRAFRLTKGARQMLVIDVAHTP